jgi:hypothetical protein
MNYDMNLSALIQAGNNNCGKHFGEQTGKCFSEKVQLQLHLPLLLDPNGNASVAQICE